MDVSTWMALESAMQGDQPRRGVSGATLRRIGGFAHASTDAALVPPAQRDRGDDHRGDAVLAGVVDAIIEGQAVGTVIGLAIVIAALAIAAAGLGLVTRWLSARIGEGLILDLRRAVFSHVQRMRRRSSPARGPPRWSAGFNNDVIGAQRAFAWTLSGVVENVISLVLTLAVMLSLSWQVTVLALILLPVFVVPAWRMGNRLASWSARRRPTMRR